MDHTLLVGAVQGVGDLDGGPRELPGRERPPAQTVGERFPLQVFHDQVIDPVLMAYVVQGADVRMVQAGDGARLALEAQTEVGVVGEVSGKDLDGDGPVESRVSRPIHLSHSARATGRQDLVGAQPCAGA